MLVRLLKISRFGFCVRVRYAPSPTGPMHLGAVRTALFNYMFAKHNNGKFIIRIEDTDLQRNIKGSDQQILDTLEWLGIKADQSPRVGGAYGPYVQSQRLEVYRRVIEELVGRGVAYPCFCGAGATGKKARSKGEEAGPQGYDGKCRKLTPQQSTALINSGHKHAIRLNSTLHPLPPTIPDLLHITLPSTPIDDFILLKQNGYPTYHFANVIDDWQMKITHVIRGMQWMSNTSKHWYLYRVLGVRPPIFGHLPLIYSSQGKKLSKRDPTAPVKGLRDRGYLAQAIVNYVGLMGYNPGPDNDPQQPLNKSQTPSPPKSQYYTLPDLIPNFTLEKLKPSPTKSDQKKLNYFNRYYLRKKWKEQDKQFVGEVYGKFREWFGLKEGAREWGEGFLREVVECTMERVDCLEEFREYGYFFGRADLASEAALKDIKKIFGPQTTLQQSPTPKLLNPSTPTLPKSLKILHNLRLIFTHILPPQPQSYTQQKIAQTISQFLYDNKDISNEDAYHLLRLAVTGRKSGVNIVRTCRVLGRERVLGDLGRLYEIVANSQVQK